MKTYFLTFILCLFATLAVARTIELVTGNGYQPFTDESLPQGGMITEIVELAFQNVRYRPSVVFRPWKRGYEETKQGIFAGTFPHIKSEERLKDFYFSNPIDTVYIRVFVAKDSPIQKMEDLRDKRICIPLGYEVSKRLGDTINYNLNQQEGRPIDLSGCLHMIQSGRKDFFIINEMHGWMTIQKIFHTKAKAYFRTLKSEKSTEKETHHLIVSKTHPDGKRIISDFNKGLKNIKEEGILEKIRVVPQ